jgi:hypothetical protein
MPMDIVIIIALPVGFLMAAIEGRILMSVRKRPYNWRGYLVSMLDGCIRQYIINPFFGLSFSLPGRIASIPCP